jgi:hypothetical protein
MEILSKPNYLRYGGATKLISEMNNEELQQMREDISKKIREKNFSYGRPIIYGKDGIVYREWQDGTIEIINE